jgi:hypothetical protein
MITTYEDRVVYRNEKKELHREDGPAIEYNNGTMLYYINGILRREDGPAIIRADGKKQYWIYVGTDSRGFHFHAAYFNYPGRIKYRVMAGCRNFTGNQALRHWRGNPECLELAKKAIAKFETIKALIAKESLQNEAPCLATIGE